MPKHKKGERGASSRALSGEGPRRGGTAVLNPPEVIEKPEELLDDEGFKEFAENTAEGKLHQRLWTATSWIEIAVLLHGPPNDPENPGLGLEKGQIAAAACVQPSTVTKWLDPATTEIELRSPERLADLRYVVMALLRSRRMTIDSLRFWLALDGDPVLGEAPLAAIAGGRFERVVEAGTALASLRAPLTRGEAEADSRVRSALRSTPSREMAHTS